LHRLAIVLRHAFADLVQVAEIVLSLGVSLVSRSSIPLLGLRIVLCHTLPALVHDPKPILGGSIAAVGKWFGKAQSRLVIAAPVRVIRVFDRSGECRTDQRPRRKEPPPIGPHFSLESARSVRNEARVRAKDTASSSFAHTFAANSSPIF